LAALKDHLHIMALLQAGGTHKKGPTRRGSQKRERDEGSS